MKALSSFISVLILSVSFFTCKDVKGEPRNFKQYEKYYGILANDLEGKYIDGKGILMQHSKIKRVQMNIEYASEIYEIIDTAYFIEDEFNKRMIIITHSDGYSENNEKVNDCHACTTSLNYYEYDIEDNKYSISKVRQNFSRAGSFGSDNYKIEVWPINDYDYFIAVFTEYSGMGQTEEILDLFKGSDLILTTFTGSNGSILVDDKEKNYGYTTQYSIDNENNTITFKTSGTNLNIEGDEIEVSKSKTWNYITEQATWSY